MKNFLKEKYFDIIWTLKEKKKSLTLALIIFLIAMLSFAFGFLFCYNFFKVPQIIIKGESGIIYSPDVK